MIPTERRLQLAVDLDELAGEGSDGETFKGKTLTGPGEMFELAAEIAAEALLECIALETAIGWRGEAEAKYPLVAYGPTRDEVARTLFAEWQRVYGGPSTWAETVEDFADNLQWEQVPPAGVVLCGGEPT